MNEKVFRILVVALLAIVAITPLLPEPTVEPTEECSMARATAQRLAASEDDRLSFLLDQYDDLVYTQAENINQQILLSNESIFAAVALDVQLKFAMLDLLANCN